MEDSSGIPSFVLILYCFSLFIIMVMIAASLKIIPENKRFQVYRLGRYIGEKGPGIVLLMPLIDKGIIVDVLDQITRVKKHMDYSGTIGETITSVHSDGKVIVNNETINAISKDPIPAGQRVRIVKVVVEVEKLL
jgi:regulator of protease activity HflC (stomatin/prohibitin superfamily)